MIVTAKTARSLVFLFFLAARAVSAESPPASTQSVHYTVLPGERVMDLCARLEKDGISTTRLFLDVASTTSFPEFPFVPAPRANINRFEGLFVPGRYTVELDGASGGASTADMRRGGRLVLTRKVIEEQLRASARRLRGFHSEIGLSLRQSITLASIVEKEAVNGKDYGAIASVFANRLRAGMPLASCPAVEYALGYHRPYLLFSDIRIDSPYNLYLYGGLPPTPIAFFSHAAFRAVMNPPKTSNLFVVYDWVRKRHFFASTYAAHKANTEIALRHFIAAYGAAALFRKEPGKFYQD